MPPTPSKGHSSGLCHLFPVADPLPYRLPPPLLWNALGEGQSVSGRGWAFSLAQCIQGESSNPVHSPHAQPSPDLPRAGGNFATGRNVLPPTPPW